MTDATATRARFDHCAFHPELEAAGDFEMQAATRDDNTKVVYILPLCSVCLEADITLVAEAARRVLEVHLTAVARQLAARMN